MHISIIDDEKNLTSKISKKLKLNWYTVSEFYSYKDFMREGFFDDITDLYIVDLSLWDGSWFQLVKDIRNHKKSQIPIIIISWYGDINNKIYWLDIWADDYLTKPFYPEELLSRVKAILRRPTVLSNNTKDLVYKNIVIKSPNNDVFLNWNLILLNNKERFIVSFFIKNKWRIILKESFIKTIWWHQSIFEVSDNTINATLSKLRKKLWDDFPIETKRNLWYILQ